MRIRQTSARALQVTVCVVLVISGLVVASPSGATSHRIADATTVSEIVSASDYKPDQHGEILRLYRAIFNREPDVGGAKYWIDTIFEGQDKSILEVTSFIATEDQPEFKKLYADIRTNEEFVERIYSNMLGRPAEAGGKQYWVGQMSSGLSRGNTVRFVALSEEFVSRFPYMPGEDAAVAPAAPVPAAPAPVVPAAPELPAPPVEIPEDLPLPQDLLDLIDDLPVPEPPPDPGLPDLECLFFGIIESVDTTYRNSPRSMADLQKFAQDSIRDRTDLSLQLGAPLDADASNAASLFAEIELFSQIFAADPPQLEQALAGIASQRPQVLASERALEAFARTECGIDLQPINFGGLDL